MGWDPYTTLGATLCTGSINNGSGCCNGPLSTATYRLPPQTPHLEGAERWTRHTVSPDHGYCGPRPLAMRDSQKHDHMVTPPPPPPPATKTFKLHSNRAPALSAESFGVSRGSCSFVCDKNYMSTDFLRHAPAAGSGAILPCRVQTLRASSSETRVAGIDCVDATSIIR